MSKATRQTIVVTAFFLAWGCGAIAPLQAGSLDPATSPSRLPAAFPKGTWDLEATGSFAWEFYPYDHEKLATGSLAIGYYPADNFSVSFGIPVSHVRQPETRDATMIGLDLRLRYHFIQHERFTLFGDLTGGLCQSSREVPPFGTYFNFTVQVGMGATWRLTDHVDLVSGLHLFHLSNAAIEGAYRNPDLNAVQPYLGVMFTF